MSSQVQTPAVSGDQEYYKILEAQDALKQLQNLSTTLGSGNPIGVSKESIDFVLNKASDLVKTQMSKAGLDANSSKLLNDINTLIGSVKQLATEKDIGESLKKISIETAKAATEVEVDPKSVAKGAVDIASLRALTFAQTWRTLFELLMTSREFRTLVVDFTDVARRVFSRHVEGLGTMAKQEYIAGKTGTEIALDVGGEAKSKMQSPATGELEVKISDEESERLQTDAAKLMLILGRNPNFRNGARGIFDLLDMAREQANADPNAPVAEAKPHSKKAQKETQALIAKFSGKEKLDEFMENLRSLIRKVERDDETRAYLSNLREFILEDSIKENADERYLKERTKQLIDTGRYLVDKYRYGDEVNDFLDSLGELKDNIKNDSLVRVMKHHAGIVATDLQLTDPSSGEIKFDTELIGKIRTVILPVLADALKYIPIPKIQSSDENRSYWVDNIVLCGYDVVPDRVKVYLESESELSVRDIEVKKSYTRLVITLHEIRTELKDLDFYYNKKTFPQMEDSGRLSLRLGGDGATLTMYFNVEQNTPGAAPRLTDGKANFDIHNIDITYDKRTLTHDVLVPMLTALFKLNIQRAIEEEVEKNLQKLIDSVGSRLTEALIGVNRPLVSKLDVVKTAIQGTEVGQTYEARREKLE